MNALADHALLGIWERGAGCGPVERGLLLLGAALPEQSPERCALNAPSGLAWSQSLLDEVEGGMTALESATDIELRFDCIACGEAWSDRLDVAGCVWEEIAARARRLLDEVHGLAIYYGWSEQ